MQYWVYKNGQSLGPYDSFTIEGKVAVGEFGLDDQVCLVGTERWALIRDTFHAAENWTLNRETMHFQSNKTVIPQTNSRKPNGKFLAHNCHYCNQVDYKSIACTSCGTEDRWQTIVNDRRQPRLGLYCGACERGSSTWVCQHCGSNNGINTQNP